MISTDDCSIWLYGPQVNLKNEPYAVGGTEWYTIYTDCIVRKNLLKNIGLKLDDIRLAIITQGSKSQFLKTIIEKIKAAKTISEILLIHAAFVHVYGQLSSNRHPQEYSKLFKWYNVVYETTKTLLGEDRMNIFVSPEKFERLDDKNANQPKNIRFQYQTLEELNSAIPLQKGLFIHPIADTMLKCSVSIKKEYADLFTNVHNELFKPLARVIECTCSFLQNSITLSTADIKYFKLIHKGTENDIYEKHPILIDKKQNTYLSQLFEKTCVLFFKPTEIKPKSETPKELLRAAIENVYINDIEYGCYANGNLSVFQTPITNVPVYFINDNEMEVERKNNSSVEFFTEVLKELLSLKVFVAIKNGSYVINTNFDIEKLDCYKTFPAAAKSAELKKKVTEYFFFFVGNILHFAVTNNLKLPFKLSLAYTMMLFNILNLNFLYDKLVFISIYLMEKATPEFVKVLENPSPDLYNTDERTFFNNIINYLSKTALHDYFDDKAQRLIIGFRNTMDFDSTTMYPMKTITMSRAANAKNEDILNKILKASAYLCE